MREELVKQRKIKAKERDFKDNLIHVRSIPGVEVYNKTSGMNRTVKLSLENGYKGILNQNIADRQILKLESGVLSPKQRDKHAPARYFS
jgi:hypothetical protein